MTKFKRSLRFLVGFLLVSVFVVRPAYAYIDPGSGSYLWLLISSGLFALSFSIKSFWIKLKSLVSAPFSKKRKDEKSPR